MIRRHFALVLASLVSVAHAEPSVAPSASSSAAPAVTPASPRDRWAGTYSYVGGDAEIAARDVAIEKATDGMFFAIRGIARSKLRDRLPARQSLAFSFPNGNIASTVTGTPPAVSPADGRTVPYKNEDGDMVQLTQKINSAGEISQTIASSDGSRTTRFVLSADGKTLTAFYVIASSRLPQAISYQLTYRRN